MPIGILYTVYVQCMYTCAHRCVYGLTYHNYSAAIVVIPVHIYNVRVH